MIAKMENIYRHYRNKWLYTHLITILEVRSRAGNDGVPHEILIVTMKHWCTHNYNYCIKNKRCSSFNSITSSMSSAPIYSTSAVCLQIHYSQRKQHTSQLHRLLHKYVYTPRKSLLPKRTIGTLVYTTRHKDQTFSGQHQPALPTLSTSAPDVLLLRHLVEVVYTSHNVNTTWRLKERDVLRKNKRIEARSREWKCEEDLPL
jgi:hypothetical protein